MVRIEREVLAEVLEALKAAYTEIDAMMDSYDDYAPSGDLCEQIEEAINKLEAELDEA